MSVPGIVQAALDGDDIAARVSLGGDDELFVTASRTLVYRSEGLLSDESVDEFPHDADRLTVSEGRRKTTITLEYSLEGTREVTVPASTTDEVLHSVLAGVLNGNGITDSGETVVQLYRFSELTLIVTSDRLVKHIGEAVWDEDFEEYHYADVTGLEFEDGSVATSIVLHVDGRPQRIKAPNEEATGLRERLERALFAYHEVDSLEALNDAVGGDDTAERTRSTVDFGDGVDPLDANPPEPDDASLDEAAATDAAAGPDASASDPMAPQDDARTDATRTDEPEPTGSTQEPATTADEAETAHETETTFEMSSGSSTDESTPSVDAGSGTLLEDAASGSAEDGQEPEYKELLERVASLEAAVERQTEVIEDQQQTIEQLVAELRAGR